MKIAIAGDHAGFELKAFIAADLKNSGHQALDLGTFAPAPPVDYPDFAAKVAEAVLKGEAERGIVICGSGVGASIAANKFQGIRAGLCHDTYSARQGVEHDNMNVLCMGSRVIGQELAREIVKAFNGAVFSNEERHIRRLSKIKALERKNLAE